MQVILLFSVHLYGCVMSETGATNNVAQMKVLVIENKEAMQGILAALLRRYGKEHGVSVRVRAIYDPVQGLYELCLRGGAYDVIIMDDDMPKLGGDQIYGVLKRDYPHMAGNIVFITRYRCELEKRFPGTRLSVLDKPFTYASLTQRMEEITGQDRRRSPARIVWENIPLQCV